MAERSDALANSVCARCGRMFHCGIDDDRPCWCAVEFPAVLGGEPEQYCLCPDCLRAKIAARDDTPT